MLDHANGTGGVSEKKRNALLVLFVALLSAAICLFDFWSVFTGE